MSPRNVSQQSNGDGRSRTRAQANDLAVVHILQAGSRCYFFFCIIGHSSLESHFDREEIGAQSESENRGQDGYQVNYEAGGLKCAAIQ